MIGYSAVHTKKQKSSGFRKEKRMELILISNTKLKVMLSASDMQKYELDNNSIDYDNTETRKAFWQILDEAKHKTGFDAASDKVFIQVYPSRGGGCEMYVTKLGGARCEEQGTEPPAHKKQFSLLRGKTGIYRFSELGHVISVCRRLHELGYSFESGLYLNEEGMYDLVLYEKLSSGSFPAKGIGEYSFIEEFATRRQGFMELAYIKEHGKCIEETHAVEKMASV